MRAGRWAVGALEVAHRPGGISRRPSRNRRMSIAAEVMDSIAPSIAGGFFQLLRRFYGGLPVVRKLVASMQAAVTAVTAVFLFSGWNGEKKRDMEKGKVEIRKNRRNRRTVLRPATVRASAEMTE